MVVKRLPDNELYHHGILGQKWGVRRFQNKDGTLTNAGRKRKGLLQTIKNKRKAKKLRKAKERKQAEKAFKEDLIRSGDRRQIERNKHMFTDEEMQRAINRIEMNDKLKTYSPNGNNGRTAQNGKDYVNSISNSLKLIASAADATSKTVNAVKAVNDVLGSSKKTP